MLIYCTPIITCTPEEYIRVLIKSCDRPKDDGFSVINDLLFQHG